MLRPDKIKTFIQYNNRQYYIPADCSFSQSNSWNTIDRRSTDSSNCVQNISILQRHGRQPNAYNLTFNRVPVVEGENIWTLIADYESLIGKEISFVYSGYPFRGLIITDGSFTIENDGITGANRLSISYSMRESVVLTPASIGDVRLL